MTYPEDQGQGKSMERPSSASATLQDVAREAGVSLATASRSLNGSARRVNEEYRQRVVEAAARLNYSPNISAQAVARGRFPAIALVVSDITDPYFSAIAAAVFLAAEAEGLLVTMAASGRRVDRELEIVTALRSQKPQVLMLVGSRTTDADATSRLEAELQVFSNDGGRVALISQAGLPFDTVAPANELGANQLAVRMFELGYRRFAVLAGPDDLLTARDRTEGIRKGLASRGVELGDAQVVHGDFTRDGGYHATGELMQRDLDTEIVLAVNDVMAVGAMARLREEGVSLPQDLAVAGFDDIPTLRDVAPALTTVQLPLAALGEAAVRLSTGPSDLHPRLESVEGIVLVRASTPPLAR